MNIEKLKIKMTNEFYTNTDSDKLVRDILDTYFATDEEKFNFILTWTQDYAKGDKIDSAFLELLREKLELPQIEKALYDIVFERVRNVYTSLVIKPFDWIRKCDPNALLTLIQQEMPQTIAVILSYLEPNKASVLLQNLPHSVQSEVARRIACMDRCTPETLREVERVLEKKLDRLSSESCWTVPGGVESIVEILNLVDRASEKQIIEALEDEDPELAEEIKKRMFIFEDIIMLDDRCIQKVMREVDSQELAKALFNVDEEVTEKIFRNFSKRAVAMLKEDMEYMGPIRVKDVEEAQQKIVAIIRHLEDTGDITIARAGEDELITAPQSREGISFEEKARMNTAAFSYKSVLCKYLKEVLNYIGIDTLASALTGVSKEVKKVYYRHLSFKERYLLCKLSRNNLRYFEEIDEARNKIIDQIEMLKPEEENASE